MIARLALAGVLVALGANMASPATAVAPREAAAPRVATATINTLPLSDPSTLLRPAAITPMSYRVAAQVHLNAALTRLRVRTTLSITTPAGGLTEITIGIAARRYRAYRSVDLLIDGQPRAFTYRGARSMALRLDLADAPWAEGSVHEVVIEGVIRPAASTDRQGLLRRFGSGSQAVISAGDLLPLPMERPRSVVFADPLSAPVAEEISVEITSGAALPANAVIASGELVEGPTEATGERWVYRIAPARSFALLVAPSYGRDEQVLTLPGLDGEPQEVVISAHGPRAAARADDLALAAESISDLWTRFGPGPYTHLKVVSIPGVSFAHEYPGLVTVGLRFNSIDRAHVVRHEVAHQWWHSLVATDQGRDPWMDETLTEWTTQRLEGATEVARGSSCSKPIDGPSYPSEDYYRSFFGSNQYWDCVYLRGPRLLFAIGDVIGDQRLEACLAEYAAAHRFGSPAPAVLIAVLRACADDDTEAAGIERALSRYLSAQTLEE